LGKGVLFDGIGEKNGDKQDHRARVAGRVELGHNRGLENLSSRSEGREGEGEKPCRAETLSMEIGENERANGGPRNGRGGKVVGPLDPKRIKKKSSSNRFSGGNKTSRSPNGGLGGGDERARRMRGVGKKKKLSRKKGGSWVQAWTMMQVARKKTSRCGPTKKSKGGRKPRRQLSYVSWGTEGDGDRTEYRAQKKKLKERGTPAGRERRKKRNRDEKRHAGKER